MALPFLPECEEVYRELSAWSLWKAATSERGQGLAEYGMIILFVALIAVAAIPLLGEQLSAVFTKIGGVLGSP